MQKQEFSIAITAPRALVWQVIWEDATFRQWADLIDEGTYMEGELKEGFEVHFISESGYGVKNVVTKLIPEEYVLLKQIQDTKDSGASQRPDEWTGGEESYRLAENNGVTTLVLTMDIPPSLQEIMEERVPLALERIKLMAENEAII